MRVLVCGGRNYNDRPTLYATLNELYHKKPITCIIEGDAKGADKLAGRWAFDMNIKCEVYTPDWNNINVPDAVVKYNNYGPYNAKAGHNRNLRMLVEGKPDLVVAFPGGRGTANMIKQAKQHGIEVKEITNE